MRHAAHGDEIVGGSHDSTTTGKVRTSLVARSGEIAPARSRIVGAAGGPVEGLRQAGIARVHHGASSRGRRSPAGLAVEDLVVAGAEELGDGRCGVRDHLAEHDGPARLEEMACATEDLELGTLDINLDHRGDRREFEHPVQRQRHDGLFFPGATGLDGAEFREVIRRPRPLRQAEGTQRQARGDGRGHDLDGGRTGRLHPRGAAEELHQPGVRLHRHHLSLRSGQAGGGEREQPDIGPDVPDGRPREARTP